MHFKKKIMLVLLILVLLIGTTLTICGGDNMHPEKALSNFSKLIEKGNLDELSLTIYYIPPDILPDPPLSVDDLQKWHHSQKIIINGNKLKEHMDLLNQVSHVIVTPVKGKPRIDARIYYVFETKGRGKIFSVAMWGQDDSIFINDVAVKDDEVLHDIIRPFLPKGIPFVDF
jgi:hypothetical protein